MYLDPTGGLWVSSLVAGIVALGSLLLLFWADSGLSRRGLVRLLRTAQRSNPGGPRRRPAAPAPIPLHSRRRTPRRPAA
jgi:hypothetical protein